MKRYLSFGIIFGVLVIGIVFLSWTKFPAWRDPASGGFLALLGATIVGALAVMQSIVSMWKDLKEEKKEDPKLRALTKYVNSQQMGNIFIAPGGTVNVILKMATSADLPPEAFIDNSTTGDVPRPSISHEASENQSTDHNQAFWINASASYIFQKRLSAAFPGLRDIETSYGKDAVDRLEILLQQPLSLELPNGRGQKDPFWWFRGLENMYIEKAKRLEPDRILIDDLELRINYITAIRKFSDEQRNFVYVHVLSDKPTGVYKYPEGWLDEFMRERLHTNYGYYFREGYGIWKDKLTTREELEDGTSMIDGKPVDISGAEFRLRYLTPYNFVICGQDHVLNNTSADTGTGRMLDEILRGTKSVLHLIDHIEKLPLREKIQ
jgi:hypothetical protein